jgi:hypothetical protein
MPKYSQKSLTKLSSTILDIQTIMNELITMIDCSIREGGNRSLKDQQYYYSQGWSKCDGIIKKSLHQAEISKAVDVVPYPELYSSIPAFKRLAKYIYRVQFKLLNEGKISGFLEWGGVWSKKDKKGKWTEFTDMPHWQYRKL